MMTTKEQSKRFLSVISIFIVFIIVASFTVGCKGPEPIIIEEPEEIAEPEEEEEEEEEIIDLRPLSPYTGVHVDEVFSTPICVIVENHPNSRPQSGLSHADLVYEIPVEGGYTRFLALYASPYEGRIGPVRSARPYFVYLAKEHEDGVLAHCGYSIHTVQILRDIRSKNIDEMSNGAYFERDRNRRMPHNLYTSLELLFQGAIKRGYIEIIDEDESGDGSSGEDGVNNNGSSNNSVSIQPFFSFIYEGQRANEINETARDGQGASAPRVSQITIEGQDEAAATHQSAAEQQETVSQGAAAPHQAAAQESAPKEAATKVEIKFSSDNYVDYIMDSEGNYTRHNNGKLFTDAETEEGITIKNIIVQFVAAQSFTSEGHLRITQVGEGKGLLFTGGTVEDITWVKKDNLTRTYFIGENGELFLTPGATWIHFVPTYSKVQWSVPENQDE